MLPLMITSLSLFVSASIINYESRNFSSCHMQQSHINYDKFLSPKVLALPSLGDITKS